MGERRVCRKECLEWKWYRGWISTIRKRKKGNGKRKIGTGSDIEQRGITGMGIWDMVCRTRTRRDMGKDNISSK